MIVSGLAYFPAVINTIGSVGALLLSFHSLVTFDNCLPEAVEGGGGGAGVEQEDNVYLTIG